MNYKRMSRMAAQMLGVECGFMLPALILSFAYGENGAGLSFLCTIAIAGGIALLLWLFSRGAKSGFYARDGLLCVGISWVMICLVGALPFLFSGEIPRFVDAFFEIVSGFTTTGASVVRDVEALSHGILYWRSFSHWLGGMGVLVFMLAILPASNQSGSTMHLMRAESPGPDVGKLVPRIRETALILYCIYIGLTVLDFIFLVFDMPVFDAVCTAFGTAGTGGFGIKNDSMAGYSPYIQNVTTVFLLLFGINFSCYYLLLMRRFKNLLKDEELHWYIGIVFGSIGLITLNLTLYRAFPSFGETLRNAAFQVASIMTTAGFATADFDLWPTFSKAILLLLMAVGACAGSTGGGFKVARVVLLLKTVRRSIRRVLHPKRVEVVKLNGKAVDESILNATGGYLAAYVMVFIVSFLLLSVNDFSLITHFSAVMACLNNIGPGFDAVGPTCNYADYDLLGKLVLTFDMLVGRLEMYPILILFVRDTWKRK